MNNKPTMWDNGTATVPGRKFRAGLAALTFVFSATWNPWISAPAASESESAPAAEAAETQSVAPIDGAELYNTYCAVCHKSGLNAAPKYTNKLAWAKVVAKGRDAVYKYAIDGIRGMPPRGGAANLTDEEVRAATDYLVNGSGGWGDAL